MVPPLADAPTLAEGLYTLLTRSRIRCQLMGLLLATVALVATALQSHAAAPSRDLAATPKQPQTLYASPSGTIDAFAQDGSLLAWFAPSAKGCNSVRLLSLTDGAQVSLPDESPTARNVTCQWTVVPPVRLALAQTDVLWTLRDSLSPLPFDYLLGAGYVLGAKAGRQRYEQIRRWFDQARGRAREAADTAVDRIEG